jgi:hypothetical protein
MLGVPGGANYSFDLNLLRPLDEFAAAADDLSQAAAGLEVPGSGARDRVDAANTLVKTKALGLETAVLDAFDTQVTAHAGDYAGQRRILVLAAVIIVLAAGALLWLRVPRPARPPRAGGLERFDTGVEGRHSYPVQGDDVRPHGSQRIPDLVDARNLLPPQFAQMGRAVRVRKRQDPDDHR